MIRFQRKVNTMFTLVFRHVIVGGWLLIVTAQQAYGQSIKIIAPLDGAIVSAGGTLSVSAQVTGAFERVAVIAEGFDEIVELRAPAYSATLAVPAAFVGPRTISVIGALANGGDVWSAPVRVRIESSIPIVALRVVPRRIRLNYIGDARAIKVIGSAGDGSQIDLTESARLIVASLDASIVAVDAGMVRARAAGATRVALEYGDVATTADVSVVLDDKLPSIIGMPAAGCELWPPNGSMVTVATVGVAGGPEPLEYFDVAISSSEPPGPGDIVVLGADLAPRQIRLRAKRNGFERGRVYTIKATAVTVRGITVTATATCEVPHDRR